MTVDLHGLTDPGLVRASNEDRILIDTALGLFVVCDGMGGHQQGEVAAELAVSAVRHFVDCTRGSLDVTWPFGYNFDLSVHANRLTTAVKLANRQVWRRAEQSIEYAGMGTTIAALLVADGHAIAANVGDSRIYRQRGGHFQRLSIDDTMVDSMARRGLLTADEVFVHPMRNVLTQAAGSQDSIDVHICEDPVQPGDTYLVSSDGLHSAIKDDAIRQIMDAGEPAEACAARLLDAAKGAGAPDNVSIIVVRYS